MNSSTKPRKSNLYIKWNFTSRVPSSDILYKLLDLSLVDFHRISVIPHTHQQLEVLQYIVTGVNSFLKENKFPLINFEPQRLVLLSPAQFHGIMLYKYDIYEKQAYGLHDTRHVYMRHDENIVSYAAILCHELVHEAGYIGVNCEFQGGSANTSVFQSGIARASSGLFWMLNEAITEDIAIRIRKSLTIPIFNTSDNELFSTIQNYKPCLVLYYGILEKVKLQGGDYVGLEKAFWHDYFYGTFTFPYILNRELPGVLSLLAKITIQQISNPHEMLSLMNQLPISEYNMRAMRNYYNIEQKAED